jgi:hypothetical protein
MRDIQDPDRVGAHRPYLLSSFKPMAGQMLIVARKA